MLTRSFLQYPNQRPPSSPVNTKENVSLGNQRTVRVKFTRQLGEETDKQSTQTTSHSLSGHAEDPLLWLANYFGLYSV